MAPSCTQPCCNPCSVKASSSQILPSQIPKIATCCTQPCCEPCSVKVSSTQILPSHQTPKMATSCTQPCCDPCSMKASSTQVQIPKMATIGAQPCCDHCSMKASSTQLLPSQIPKMAAICAKPCCDPCLTRASSVHPCSPCCHNCSMKQVIQNEFWASVCNDSAMMEEVLATHTPDCRKVDVKPILRTIENILLRASPSIADVSSCALADKERTSLPVFDVNFKALACIINKVACELSSFDKFFVTATVNANNLKPTINPCGTKMPCNCKWLDGRCEHTTHLQMTSKCSAGGDVHATTMVLLNTLSNYSWDAKVVLTVAAFALNYGEFFAFAPCYGKNSSLAQPMALLKQLRNITEHAQLTTPKFDEIIKLVKAIIGVTKWIVDFNNLSFGCLATNEPPVSVSIAYIPKASYWTMLAVVACALHIASTNVCQEPTMVSWNLSCLASEGRRIQEVLKNQLTICKECIDQKCITAYWDLVNIINMCHQDNIKVLKTLIFADDCWQHIMDSSNKRISIEEFRAKYVLLLISGLDLCKEEICTLSKLYQESRWNVEIQYQVVWVPIVDKSISWDQEKQQKFEWLCSLMPWNVVPEPSKIKPEVIKYIKNVWHFTKKMILVPIDPRGRVQSLNAIDMLWIWGNSAFPFFIEKEESLWETQSWTLELILGNIDKTVLDWTKEGRIVCFYGGEDIEWIRDFTHAAKNAARNVAGISLELVYVGKSNAMKQVEKIIKTIEAEKLSYYWIDPTSIWFFWTRLESILYLKMQQGKNLKNDCIMREVTTLLSYDCSDKGWALFCKGSCERAMARGDVALKGMKQFNEWKDSAIANAFLPVLSEYFQQSHTVEHCNRIILAGNRWEIPSNLLSTEGCHCSLEKCFMYRCCVD